MEATHEGEAGRVTQLGSLVSDELLALSRDDTLLLVVDATGREENGDIADAIVASSRRAGAETIFVETDDAPLDAEGRRTEYLPDAVGAAMSHVTAIVSLTRTTSAPLPHHAIPIGLIRDNRVRGVFMAKRARADLLGESVLGVDYQFMSSVTETWTAGFAGGKELRMTSAAGTDLRASIEGMPVHCSQFAHRPGTMSPINWGEVYQGPVVGSARGIVVVDGPILGYGWPSEPVSVEIENGLAVGMDGPAEIVDPLWEQVRAVENGCNVAELAVGINPRANGRAANVYKKGLGRAHFALGSGLVYDQGVDSPIHIDFILTEPTITVDGTAMIVDGRPTDPRLVSGEAGADR